LCPGGIKSTNVTNEKDKSECMIWKHKSQCPFLSFYYIILEHKLVYEF
jgi:hypothetical protein